MKKLEHHLKYLENKKRQKNMDETRLSEKPNVVASVSTLEENCEKKRQFGKKANVKIMVVQTHANLRIECQNMKQIQLIKFLSEVENLGLTILHLNINTIHNSSSYSLSLKVIKNVLPFYEFETYSVIRV